MIDLIIVAAYFIFIIIATYKSVDKIEGINSFAIGERKFSTYALTSTISATWVSGSGFFIDISDTYKKGWYYLFPALCMGILLLLVARVFVPRMKEFLGQTSIATAMGGIYGNKVRMITALAGVVACCGPIAIQFKAAGYIGEYFLKLDNLYFVIGIGTIVTIYSFFGGIKAVVNTDIIQKNAFFIAVPILFFVCLYSFLSQNTPRVDAIDYSKFDLIHVLTTPNAQFFDMIILAIYFTIPGFNPPAFQRISMGKDIPQVVKSWSNAAIHLTAFTLSVSFIGWMLFLMNPNLEGNEMLAYLIDNYLFTGLKGILIVGIMAMIMSTADSFLNIGSVLIANDYYRIHTLSEGTKLMYARFWTLAIGFISIIIASFNANLLPIILTTASFYMPIVSVPLIFTIFGYRSTERCVLIAMEAAFLTVTSLLLLDYLDIFSLKPLVPGMLVNAIFLVSSHFLLEKRKMYTGLNDDGYFEEYKYIHSNKLYRAKYWFFNTILRQEYNDDILLAFLHRELGNNTVKLNEKKFIKEYGLNKENYYDQIKRLEKLRWIIRNDNGLKILKNGSY